MAMLDARDSADTARVMGDTFLSLYRLHQMRW
jgi:hypothetical protein